jgi:hypothetical protein
MRGGGFSPLGRIPVFGQRALLASRVARASRPWTALRPANVGETPMPHTGKMPVPQKGSDALSKNWDAPSAPRRQNPLLDCEQGAQAQEKARLWNCVIYDISWQWPMS